MNYSKYVTTLVISSFVVAGIFGAMSVSAKSDDDDDDNEDRKPNKELRSIQPPGTKVHVEENGNALIRGAIVRSISTSTIQAVTSWGNGFVEWRIRIDSNTDFIRRHGGRRIISDVSVGDNISFQGQITEEGPMPTVLARTVKNWSVEKTKSKLSGVIQSLNATSSHFMMSVSGNGTYDVAVSSTTEIRKGTSTIPFASLAAGNEVRVEGPLNAEAHTVAAERVEVKPPPMSSPVRLRTIFEGAVTTAPGSTTPTTLRVRVSGRDMSVDVSTATLLVNKIWRRIAIGDIETDHKVQIYGASAVDGNSILDVTLLRDLSI